MADRSVKNPIADRAPRSVRSIVKRIRTNAADSAFVYFVLEAHEGICSYSTLPFVPGSPYRDMILRIPPGFEDEVREALAPLGDKIYELT